MHPLKDQREGVKYGRGVKYGVTPVSRKWLKQNYIPGPFLKCCILRNVNNIIPADENFKYLLGTQMNLSVNYSL